MCYICHSCDANLVHRYLDLIFQLNIRLKKCNIFLNCDTIHDSFGIDSQFLLVLKPLLMQIYNDFYKSNFREELQKNLNETEKEFIKNIINHDSNNSFTEITNSNFVKI